MSRVLGEGAKPSGFNGDGPTEATFFKHQRAYEAIESDKASLRGKVKKAKKAAADDGVDWDDLKDLSGLRGSGAAEAEAARLQRMARYLGYMKNPLAAVLATMSEFKTDETSLTEEEREKKWRDHGYVGSREGKGLDQVLEGHDPNGDTGRWIRSGWEAGQKENAAPIKEPAKAKGKEKPDTVKADDKPKPQPEPEVAAANKKAASKAKPGVVYYHNVEAKKVLELDQHAVFPEGYVPITRPEFEKLKAEYAAAENAAWEDSRPPAGDGDGFEDGDNPPDPSKLN